MNVSVNERVGELIGAGFLGIRPRVVPGAFGAGPVVSEADAIGRLDEPATVAMWMRRCSMPFALRPMGTFDWSGLLQIVLIEEAAGETSADCAAFE